MGSWCGYLIGIPGWCGSDGDGGEVGGSDVCAVVEGMSEAEAVVVGGRRGRVRR